MSTRSKTSSTFEAHHVCSNPACNAPLYSNVRFCPFCAAPQEQVSTAIAADPAPKAPSQPMEKTGKQNRKQKISEQLDTVEPSATIADTGVKNPVIHTTGFDLPTHIENVHTQDAAPIQQPAKPATNPNKKSFGWFKYSFILVSIYFGTNWYLDYQKSNDLAQLCTDARSAIQTKEFDLAKRLAELLLVKEPKNTCAKDMLKQANLGIAKSKREQEQREQAERLKQQEEQARAAAIELAHQKNLEDIEARAAAAQAAAKQAQDAINAAQERQKQLADEQNQRLRLEAQQRLAQINSRNAPDTTQLIREQIREHFRAIGDAKAKKQWSVALDRAKQILRLDPNNREAQRQIEEINRITSSGFSNL